MTATLLAKVLAYNREIKEALLTVIGELNPGQQKKLRNNETVRRLLSRYHIEGKESGWSE